MRTAPSRIRRLLALLLLALSVGWLLLRRRAGASAPALVAVPDLPADPPERETLATDAGVTAEPEAPAPEPVAEPAADVPSDVIATDAGLTEAPPPPDAATADAATADASPADASPADAASTDAAPADAALADGAPGDPVAADGAPGDGGTVETGPPTDVIPAAPAREMDPDATTVLPRYVDPDEPAPTGTDDLRAIRGIGPAIERTLHELGITTYQQIVELEGPQLERVRDRLEAFSARIEREDWRGQARDLHRAKYGEQR